MSINKLNKFTKQNADAAIGSYVCDKHYAERRARLSSDDFRKEKNIKIKEIKLDEEQVVWISNFGA